MIIWGMEIKHPSVRSLILAAILIAATAGIASILALTGKISPDRVWPMVLAISSGAIMSAFGISLVKHGWKVVVITVVLCSIIYLVRMV